MSLEHATIEALAYDPDARAKWVHDLRNGVNVLGVGTRLAQRMIEHGQIEDASCVLADSMGAWMQCQTLLEHAGEATLLITPPRLHAPVVDYPRSRH